MDGSGYQEDEMPSRDEENEEEKEQSKINSSVVVKKSKINFPVQFQVLKSDVDLKTPPPNWLQGNPYIRIHNLSPRHSFSSFLMANQFMDCIGGVDVVSDAENIKKLLKMPYNRKCHVSMMVHNVMKTLLIDDFDVCKYLACTSDTQWKWFKSFFFNDVLQSFSHKGNALVRPNKSSEVVQSRRLLSKFLHYSISDQGNGSSSTVEPPKSPTLSTHESPQCAVDIPEPSLEEQIPYCSVNSFTRNIIWNFENLRMLIGTDLPIFGGRTHPCVSLRLKDMNRPINILTGIDYWLDNLMCNVPEVVMCYHLDGIVKKYELLKTEDLPNFPESPFSPRLIRDVAHNILSFLKNKATREGHTYWLFKGKDDDIVKLYDLTSLYNDECTEASEDLLECENQEHNPFTLPVAMLFYRVAKNLRSSQDASQKPATMCALLLNCIRLLSTEKHPQIVSSAHYMLSDIYIPQSLDPESPNLSDTGDGDSDATSDTDSDTETSSESVMSSQNELDFSVLSATSRSSINLSSLCESHRPCPKESDYKPPPLPLDIEERCQNALCHVTESLAILLMKKTASPFKCTSGTGKDGIACSSGEEKQQMASPFVPIPMPYSPLKKPDKVENSSEEQHGKVIVPRKSPDEVTVLCQGKLYTVANWHDKLLVLLLQKASLIYLTVAGISYRNKRYGSSLYHIKLGLHSWQCMWHYLIGTGQDVPLYIKALALSGDLYYMISKSWSQISTFTEEYCDIETKEERMTQLLSSIVPGEESISGVSVPSCLTEALERSLLSLERVSSTCDADRLCYVRRKVAGVYNELGVSYMNKASKICSEKKLTLEGGGDLWPRSMAALNCSLDLFQSVEDVPNVALLYSNIGRFYRLCAFYCVPDSPGRMITMQEKTHYIEAIQQYEKALEVLKTRKKYPDVWDLITWEFSTTLFNLGMLIQDSPPSFATIGNCDKEAVDYLNRSLKLCDLKLPGPRLALYQYRAAIIHMRLAHSYRKKFRCGPDKRKFCHLVEMNYTKAHSLFVQLENSCDIIHIQTERAEFLEEQAKDSAAVNSQIKYHISVLELLLTCEEPLKSLQTTSEAPEKSESDRSAQHCQVPLNLDKVTSPAEGHLSEVHTKLIAFEKRLHRSLMSLIKLHGNLKKKSTKVEILKEMYNASLNKKSLPLEAHLSGALSTVRHLLPKLLQK